MLLCHHEAKKYVLESWWLVGQTHWKLMAWSHSEFSRSVHCKKVVWKRRCHLKPVTFPDLQKNKCLQGQGLLLRYIAVRWNLKNTMHYTVGVLRCDVKLALYWSWSAVFVLTTDLSLVLFCNPFISYTWMCMLLLLSSQYLLSQCHFINTNFKIINYLPMLWFLM